MADERRYDEKEVRAILDLAVTGDSLEGRSEEASEHGLTLNEIKEIALEVGVVPTRVAEAARSLEFHSAVLPTRRSIGMPLELGRVLDVRREVTEDEWRLIVAELRDAIGEQGQIMSRGGIREWTAGTFQAVLEPTHRGHRICLRVHKEGARLGNAVGSGILAVGLILLAWIVSGTSPPIVEVSMLLSMAIGGGILVSGLLSLPRWTRLREGQLEHVVDRVTALLAEPAHEPPPRP
jgi:hypothetical protein